MLLILTFIIIFIASIFVPGAVIVILLVNSAVAIFVAVSQVATAFLSHAHNALPRKQLDAHPFVSILIPTYNEPPALVMQTLGALSLLNYDNFEVLIIDNNTCDLLTWKPVQTYAQTLGEKFRFWHVDHLAGFKAGALNYVLRYAAPQSAYAAVIDADYVVERNFLLAALSYFVEDDIALVQFPQSYRNGTQENQPIVDEYRHFFKIFMNMANRLDCVPSTGTVSVYKINALRAIGGFRAHAITEDADAGLRLYCKGYKGVYVDTPIGYGLMPYDIEAYRKQKRRWAIGNAQSIKTLFSLFGEISLRSWIGFLTHLTAWNHLTFFPMAALAAYVIVVSPLIAVTALHQQLLDIAVASIFIVFASKFIILVIALRGKKHFFSRSCKAFLINIGMTLVYSETWPALFFNVRPAFERTNKFILKKMPSVLKNSYKELLLGTWFLLGAALGLLGSARFITITAFVAAAVSLFSVYYVYWKISSTKAYSKKIIADLEKKFKHYLQEDLPQ